MHRNHSDFFGMYFYLLRKVNFIAVAQDLQHRLAEHPSFMYHPPHAENYRIGWNCTTSTCWNANSASTCTPLSKSTFRRTASYTSSLSRNMLSTQSTSPSISTPCTGADTQSTNCTSLTRSFRRCFCPTSNPTSENSSPWPIRSRIPSSRWIQPSAPSSTSWTRTSSSQ